MGEEKINFSEYQINIMKKIIIKKILDMEDGDDIFNVLILIPSAREKLLKHINKLENNRAKGFSVAPPVSEAGLKINQSTL